jgi:aryl-alcohol dehydrogenase-like predicted oxidoreductase
MLPIPGTSPVGQLGENLAAAGLRLTDEEFQLLGSTEAGRPTDRPLNRGGSP